MGLIIAEIEMKYHDRAAELRGKIATIFVSQIHINTTLKRGFGLRIYSGPA
jgi:hypothetical protein